MLKMSKTRKLKLNLKRKTRKILKGGDPKQNKGKKHSYVPGSYIGEGHPLVLPSGRKLPGTVSVLPIRRKSSIHSSSNSNLSLNSSSRSSSRTPHRNTPPPAFNNNKLNNNDINILSKIKNKYDMNSIINYLNTLKNKNLENETKLLEQVGEHRYNVSEEYKRLQKEYLNLSEYYYDLLTIIQLLSKYELSQIIEFLSQTE